MRVAFVVNSYPPRLGGLERHMADLAAALAATGNEVAVFTLASDSAPAQIEEGVRVHRYAEQFRTGDVFGFAAPATWRRIIREIRAWRPEVISVHTRFFPMTWLGVWLGRRLGVPVVLTEHGSGHVVSDSRLVSLVSRLVDFTLGRWSFRRATVVLGISDGAVRFVRGVAGRRARLFQNATRAVACNESAGNPNRLVFVGRLVPGKGWDTFVELAERLRRDAIPFNAVVLGDGPDEQRARDLVRDRGLEGLVEVRGGVGRDEVMASLAGAVLVNPTLLAEGFQTTVLEAIAAGGRVVTYAGSQSGEALAADGAPVRIVPRGDVEALYIATVAELAVPSASFAQKKFAKWTWPARAEEYQQILANAIRRTSVGD